MVTRFFFKESSEYFQHSVISPKRIDALEMKLEGKTGPDPRYNESGVGSGGYLNGLKGSMR